MIKKLAIYAPIVLIGGLIGCNNGSDDSTPQPTPGPSLTHTIKGKLLRGENPQANVRLTVLDKDGNLVAQPADATKNKTGVDGTYEIKAPLGAYTIVADPNWGSDTSCVSVKFPATGLTGTAVAGTTTISQPDITCNGVAYSVSGTLTLPVADASKKVYITLSDGQNYSLGTSVTASSASLNYIIRGVPAGTYTLNAFLDTTGTKVQHAGDPCTTLTNISVTNNANATRDVSLTRSTPPATITEGPNLQVWPVQGVNEVMIKYGRPMQAVVTPGVPPAEIATEYAVSMNGNAEQPIKVNRDGIAIVKNALENASYVVHGKNGNTVYTPSSSTEVAKTIPSGSLSVNLQKTSNSPCYVFVFNLSKSGGINELYVTKTNASPCTLHVPASGRYYAAAWIDVNNNGIIDAGDITNFHDLSAKNIVILPASVAHTIDLRSYESNQYSKLITEIFHSPDNYDSKTYELGASVIDATKQVSNITMISGANVYVPQDMGINHDGGTGNWQFYPVIGITQAAASTTYGWRVTFTDGTTQAFSSPITWLTMLSSNPLSTTPPATPGGPLGYTWNQNDPAIKYCSFFANSGSAAPPAPSIDCKLPLPSNCFGSGWTTYLPKEYFGTFPLSSFQDPLSTDNALPLALTAGNVWGVNLYDDKGNFVKYQIKYQP